MVKKVWKAVKESHKDFKAFCKKHPCLGGFLLGAGLWYIIEELFFKWELKPGIKKLIHKEAE